MGKKNKRKDDGSHDRKKPCTSGGSASAQSPEAVKDNLRIKHLSRVLEKAEESSVDDSDEQLKIRVQLADLLLDTGSATRAADVLSKHGLHVKGTADPLLARHRLAPLLLRLGRNHDAAALLARWTSDRSTTFTICRLLSSLSAWMGGAPAQPCIDALSLCIAANPALCWILGALRPRQAMCKLEGMPAPLASEIGELRTQMRAHTDPASSSSSSARPVARGLEEALLLVMGPFDGWASCPVNGAARGGKGQAAQPWGASWRADAGSANAGRAEGSGDEADGDDDADVEERMSPQVDLLCALLVQHHSDTAPATRGTAAFAKPGDGKKVVACMEKVLQAAELAVRARAKALGEGYGLD